MDFLISHWHIASPTPSSQSLVPTSLQSEHWYHCQRDAIGLRPWLESLTIPTSIIDALLAKNTRPMFEQYDEHNFLLILRGINITDEHRAMDMPSLRLLYYHGALISADKRPSDTISRLLDQLTNGSAPCTIEALLLSIVDDLNKNIDQYLSDLEVQCSDFSQLNSLNQDLMLIHQSLIRIKRFAKPQQYALDDFRHSDLHLSKLQHLSLRHSLSTMTRLNETIDFLLSELEIIKGEIRQFHDEKMNRNTYLFSVIAAIFLPTSFLTGLFGVNVGGIPGTHLWWAFALFCLALLAIFAIEWWLLRKLGFVSTKPHTPARRSIGGPSLKSKEK